MLFRSLVHAWNAVPAAKASLPESPAVYAKRFFYDALVFDPKAVRFIIDTYGSSQICIGTDYPFNMGDDQALAKVEQSGVGPDVVRAVRYENAKRFLGIA